LNELKLLERAKKRFALVKSLKSTERKNPNIYIESIRLLNTIYLSIWEEASETPAGSRWLSGQLKINPTVNTFALEILTDNKSGDTDSDRIFSLIENWAGNEDFLAICEKYLNELNEMVNSGLNRYISG